MMIWAPDAPRFALLGGPSPLHAIPRFAATLRSDIEVWIKREDLLPQAFGGNKLRNLEFLIGAARAEGADVLVTSGRRWSNHCRLTAAASAQAGLAVELVITGPPPTEPGPNEVLEELFGARLHWTSGGRREERAALVAQVAERLRADGRHPYIIDVGGTDVTGALGQVLAGLELAEQAAALGMAPDAVIVPTATGGTQAGVMVGVALASFPVEVIGVAVAHPAAEVAPIVERLAIGLRDQVPLPSDWMPKVRIEDGFLGAGYGRRDRAADAAVARLARSEGILVDPIYTAKSLAYLVAKASQFADRTVVFWHAGGTLGIFERLDG
jgi:1-aminocyclopropane-1-carboxylate deaminase/D-cysteine desulfhydrase-like pyridoxal-dependent ACC family enzyme